MGARELNEIRMTGESAERVSHAGADTNDYTFCVLMVFESAERRNNTAERLLLDYPKIRTQVWLMTFAEITSNPLGSISVQPEDYERVIEGTPFEARKHRKPGFYRRRPERERLVEIAIKKHPLLLPIGELSDEHRVADSL